MYSDIYQNISAVNKQQNNSQTTDPNMKSSHRMSISHAKGLLNMPGQNNCFLNSAVQVLWHLDIFRRSFRELSGHACMADSCIFCALKELFNQFQYSQESALPPDALRFALAEAFCDQRRFQLGFMDDAAECFENILLRIHCHIANQDSEEMCSTTHCLPHCIPHQKFAMNLIEQIICHSCGATSEPFPFTQMVHYVSTPALCAQAKQYDCENSLTFGELLKSAGAVGDFRDCPRSCGARIQIKKSLINKPDIVSIGLVWDSERPTLNHIIDVFRAIGTTLRLPDVFDSVSDCRPTVSTVLQLVGLVTYYGKHYSTFFFHTKLREWIYFDDAAVRAIGPHWQQVVDKCIRGHFQPLLLLYANPNGTPVNTDNAPKEIIPLVVKKSPRRPYLSGLPAKCDITANNYHSLQNAQRNGMSTQITSDSETNIRSIDKKNVSNIMRQISGQNQINKLYSSQRTEQTYSNINTGLHKPIVNGFNTNNKMRPNNINTLQTNLSNQSSSDVPDSPSGMSSVSYFSDVGEMENRYISRKTVESILNLQRNSLKKSAGNRNSSSSLESFDIRNGALVFNRSLLPSDKPGICSLQRHDSGNSSGDRHSASSASVSSIDSPFFTFATQNRRPLPSYGIQRHPPSPKLSSDGGYDSFSLSSSDSYPSVQSSGSPAKMNRLKQIPEDVQLMELINASTMLDCDKLCSAADVLLLKSHEKEREGDLRAAAALSDSAASKARSAMDVPYSNHQTLITAKMKHSMCVMRSASLHKRLNEMEAEEKRRIKEQLSAVTTGAANHSRQGSRDSTHSKHSRQGSKDSKDTKNKEVLTAKHGSLDFNKIRPIDSSVTAGKTLELYATLPKKGSKKKFLQQTFNPLASLRIKSDDSNIYRDVISQRDTSICMTTESTKKKSETVKKTVIENNKSVPNNNKTKNIFSNNKIKQINSETVLKQSSRESDFSDYYSEWEATRRTQQNTESNVSGSASCKENDSEFYGEVGSFATQSTGKKQHRVRRKLLMGGFMKRKNRSLPDLREGTKDSTTEAPNGSQDILSELSEKESSTECKSIAQISAKGFHQPHRAFISERGLYQRPSLLKVSPPLIEKSEQTYESVSNVYNPSKVMSTPKNLPNHINNQFVARSPSPPPPTPPKAKASTLVNPVSPIIDTKTNDKKCVENSFLKELASKRAEIMKNCLKDNTIENTSNSQSPKEQINQTIPQSSGPNIKPALKNSSVKHNINLENDNYESINIKARTPPHSYPSHSVINQMPNSINKCISSQTTQLTSPKIAEQTDDSNPTNRSVRDLTSKFEKIMNKSEINSNEKLNEIQTDFNESNPKRIEKTDSLSSGSHRTVPMMANNKTNEEPKPMGQPVCETNKADNYSVQSPTVISSPIPITNCLTPAVRPNRPPDYQTALKRIGMLRNDKIPINIQANRAFYMNASGNIIQSPHRSPQPIPNLQIQSQLTEQQKSVTQKSNTVSSEVSKQQLLFSNNIHNNCEEIQQNSLTRKKNTFKKSVSFSDQVVLVACAEEDQEEHLPNPILERVLAKNNISFTPQSP